MKKEVLFFLLIALFTGCKEKIKNSEYDPSKIFAVNDYVYKYENGKKISEIETTQTFIQGHVMSTNVFRRFYKYNEKGLLIKETYSFNDEKESDLHSYGYNSLDSLVSETRISDGDTSDIFEYGYFPDGRKEVFMKRLHLKLLEDYNPASDLDLEKAAEELRHRQYDTLYRKIEYIYDKQLCQVKNLYNQHNEIQATVEYKYDNNNLIKEIHYVYPYPLRKIEKTVYYDYSKSKDKPDMFSIGKEKNDTIDQTIHYFKKGILLSSYCSYNWKEDIEETYYNKQGRIDKTVSTSEYLKRKMTTVFTYYDNGDIKKTVEYKEDLLNDIDDFKTLY